jgi:BioD-like phosphotransacetylase family protein
MADIKKLEIADTGYKEDVVEMLESLLEDAKKGEILEAVVITYRRDKAHYYQYTGSDNLFLLQGYLGRMLYKVNQRLDANIY